MRGNIRRRKTVVQKASTNAPARIIRAWPVMRTLWRLGLSGEITIKLQNVVFIRPPAGCMATGVPTAKCLTERGKSGDTATSLFVPSSKFVDRLILGAAAVMPRLD